MPNITVESEENPWYVDGHRRTTQDGAIMLARGELRDIRVEELLRKFEDYKALYGDAITEDEIGAVVFEGDDAYLDADEGYELISFPLREGHVCVQLVHFVLWPDDDDEIVEIERATRRTISPLLNFLGAELLAVDIDDYGFAPTNHVQLKITIAPAESSSNLQQLYELGGSVERLISAFLSAAPTRETMANLIRGGHAELLVGQPEGNWLDVKSAEYVLDGDKGKFSLAVEVAAFCNAEDGGVLVFGAATDVPTEGGGEVIVSVGGLDRVRASPRRYVSVLNSWVYPFPLDLHVEEVKLPNGNWILMVDIPAQAEESKPFLVSGAQKVGSDAKIDRESITLPQRRGEDTVRLTASMIQSQLAVGRAFLRGHKDTSSGPAKL